MSQQSVIEELQHLGMSGYEAKAYVALVAAGTPLNGYEVAKHSGVPRSTVYETLGKLVGRGAAYEVRAGEASVGYISLPPNALLDRMRREFDRSIDTLRSALPEVASPPLPLAIRYQLKIMITLSTPRMLAFFGSALAWVTSLSA